MNLLLLLLIAQQQQAPAVRGGGCPPPQLHLRPFRDHIDGRNNKYPRAEEGAVDASPMAQEGRSASYMRIWERRSTASSD